MHLISVSPNISTITLELFLAIHLKFAILLSLIPLSPFACGYLSLSVSGERDTFGISFLSHSRHVKILKTEM